MGRYTNQGTPPTMRKAGNSSWGVLERWSRFICIQYFLLEGRGVENMPSRLRLNSSCEQRPQSVHVSPNTVTGACAFLDRHSRNVAELSAVFILVCFFLVDTGI